MKRTLTPFLLLLPAVLMAQPTLTQSMIDPNGVQLDMYLATDPGTSSPPSDGANQTWDLTSVVLSPIGTLNFTQASNTPYASSYPTANWAWVQTFTGSAPDYMYLNIQSSGIEIVAESVPSSPTVYSDTKKILTFPMAFNQSFTDNYNDGGGSTPVTWSYTGYGTANTPLGNFSNLVKVISTEGDLVLWNTAPLHPLGIDDGSNILFFVPSNVGIADAIAPAALPVYPNPCTDELCVTADGNSAWRITDLQGRTVQSGRTATTGTQRLAVNDLVAGAYLLVLDGPQGPRVARFTKQ